jgi:shikimate kinase
MDGVGRAAGAITIVNALATGVGCALGIDLRAEARVRIQPRSPGAPSEIAVVTGSRTPLVEVATHHALTRYAPSGAWSVELEIHCDIPVACGLKSSSAVASAVIQAVAQAFGSTPSSLEVALLSADASRSAGVSATGALDDALAGLSDGFVVTDNYLGKLLRTGPARPEWKVALFVPPATHAPSPLWIEKFQSHAKEARGAVEAALNGEWWTAMARNSELVERTMSYAYTPLRERVLRAGALGAGVTGLGPAFAAVGPAAVADRMLQAFPRDSGERRVLSVLTTEGGGVGGPG